MITDELEHMAKRYGFLTQSVHDGDMGRTTLSFVLGNHTTVFFLEPQTLPHERRFRTKCLKQGVICHVMHDPVHVDRILRAMNESQLDLVHLLEIERKL